MKATQSVSAIPIGIAGTGSFVPENVLSTEDLAYFITSVNRGKDAAWALEKTGIKERRFMMPLDPATGFRIGPADELDMAVKAAQKALEAAGLAAQEIDGIYFISCTNIKGPQDQYFMKPAAVLHQRLGMREDALVLEAHPGCGGAVHAMVQSAALIRGAGLDNFLVVASNMPSEHYDDWPAYAKGMGVLSLYIFGDGAGAVVLRRSEKIPSESRIIDSFVGFDPAKELMSYRCDKEDGPPIYIIDGRAVAISFRHYVGKALGGLSERIADWDPQAVSRWIFHQPTKRTLDSFIETFEIKGFKLPKLRVAMHAERYGNMAGAAGLVILDEDYRSGAISNGNHVVISTVGAGVQYGALLVQM